MLVVPRATTQVQKDEALDALVAAFGPLSRELAASLLSLIWLETARGNLQNWAPGNLTASESYAGSAWRPPWFEVTDDSSEHNKQLHDAMLAGQAPSAFRAYDSLSEGMADWVRQLRQSFGEVIAAGELGDANAFRLALSKKYSDGYKNTAVTRTFAQLFKEFAPVVAALPASVQKKTLPPVSPRVGLAFYYWGRALRARSRSRSGRVTGGAEL